MIEGNCDERGSREYNIALAARVKGALAADARLKSFGIDIRAQGGVVELLGTVDSRSNRETAEKVAAEVEGVGNLAIADKLKSRTP